MTGMPSPMGHTLLRDKESTGPDKPVRHLAPTTSEHGPTTVRGQPTRGGNMWQGRLGTIGLILAAAIFALPLYAPTSGANRANQVEVYSWWTGPGEEDGLRAMVADFEAKNPGVRLINAAVSGGAGSNAKAILASRLLANDPPDSYQRHAGLELADDVRSGKVRDITALYEEQGWKKVFPQGLLDKITIDGRLYAVPVNIHRANLIWYNPRTLRALGIGGPPGPADRRAGVDPEAPAGDGAARRAGPGQLRETVGRHHRLDLASRTGRAGHVQAGARAVGHRIERGRLAAAAGPGRRRFHGVRRHGRLELLLPHPDQEAGVAT